MSNIVDQISLLQAAFNKVAEIVGKDPQELDEVIRQVQNVTNLLAVYEEAIRQNVDPHEAADMQELALCLLEKGKERLRRVSRPLLTKKEINTDKYREKLRKAWQNSGINQTIIDMPFSEYAEEFVTYLSTRLAEVTKEHE